MEEQYDWVVSKLLDWMPMEKNIGSELRSVGLQNSVTIRVVGKPNLGGFPVQVFGRRHFVREFIKKEWGSNDTGESLEWFADMMLGDKLAEHRWNSGCRVGLPGEPDVADSPKAEADHKLNWDAHWDQAGPHNPNADFYNSAAEWAIDILAIDCGYSDPEDENVQRAQTYLMLAAHYVPELIQYADRIGKHRKIG